MLVTDKLSMPVYNNFQGHW